MSRLSQRFLHEENGQDIIEYAFLAAFVSVVAYGLVVTIGQDVMTIYTATDGTTSAGASAAAAGAS